MSIGEDVALSCMTSNRKFSSDKKLVSFACSLRFAFLTLIKFYPHAIRSMSWLILYHWISSITV